MGVKMRYGTAGAIENAESGGGETLTLLWTNPSPTSNLTAQAVTISQAANTFKKLRIYYAYNTGTDPNFWVDYPVMLKDGSGYMFPTGDGYQKMMFGLMNSSGNSYCRRAAIQSDTQVYFYACQRVNASNTNNGNCVPWYIYGIN